MRRHFSFIWDWFHAIPFALEKPNLDGEVLIWISMWVRSCWFCSEYSVWAACSVVPKDNTTCPIEHICESNHYNSSKHMPWTIALHPFIKPSYVSPCPRIAQRIVKDPSSLCLEFGPGFMVSFCLGISWATLAWLCFKAEKISLGLWPDPYGQELGISCCSGHAAQLVIVMMKRVSRV